MKKVMQNPVQRGIQSCIVLMVTAMVMMGFSARAMNLQLTAEPTNNGVALRWPQEKNAPSFYVERFDSTSGTFEPIAWIKNLNPEVEVLEFVDNSVGCGAYTYQLHVVDEKGRNYFSSVQTVVIEKVDPQTVEVNQKPVLEIGKFARRESIRLTNIQVTQLQGLSVISPNDGRKISVQPKIEPFKVTIPIDHLTKGHYALIYTYNGQKIVERFEVN